MLQIAIVFQHKTLAEIGQAVTTDSEDKFTTTHMQLNNNNTQHRHSIHTEVINTTAAQRQNEETEEQYIEWL